MRKHFVTVCVFCLLCATHTPCSSHVQVSTSDNRLNEEQISTINDPNRLSVKNIAFEKITDRYSPTTTYQHDHDDELAIGTNSIDSSISLSLNSKDRMKRDIHRKLKFDDAIFIEKIFNDFGNGQVMTYEGFQRLIKSLHLDRLLSNNHSAYSGNPTKLAANGIHNDTNSTCMDHRDLISSVRGDLSSVNNNNNNNNNTSNSETDIESSSFRKLCPVLLYQLVAPSSAERQGCIKIQQKDLGAMAEDEIKHFHTTATRSNINRTKVWLYSTLSILIISVCGLFGVIVIPIMKKHFYHHLIQFLVALAVGTLAGDALLHLLPHAMMSHQHDDGPNHDGHDDNAEDQHTKNMWRGFVAMIGLIFFFFMEKCLTLCAEWRKQRQLRKNKVPARVRVMRETDTASPSSVGCKHKYSSYPYCYGVIATETQDDHHNHPQHNNTNANDAHNTATILNELDSDSEFLTKHGGAGEHHQHNTAGGDNNTTTHHETNQNMSKCTNNTRNMKCSESNKMLADHADTHTLQDFTAPKNEISESESYTVILRTHENKHHGHSHTHGHVHSAPKSLSSVAWMVVMGDGLHNFTDGMAIGAAFAGSIAGGFSTAVAVFCHELPHEIGDFAVLLKAGMTGKQAVFYNILSSVLCLFGMIIGVVLGHNDAASSWLFACAAGMFLYIALVDMIPELTTSHSKEGGSFLQCILQFFGLLSGLGIMLLIAMYEHDLKRLFHE